MPILRADFTLCETYRYTPEPPLDCPISAFGGLQDKEVPLASLEAWKEQTRGPFKKRLFAGNHFFLLKHERLLLTVLRQELLNALPRG
jgi:medium-chain acyl-[acyl-carrier-protein] hydrolase